MSACRLAVRPCLRVVLVVSIGRLVSLAGNGHEVAGEQIVSGHPSPGAVAVDEDGIGAVAHLADLVQVAELLLHQCALEHDEEAESEQRVVPHLVERPEHNAEHLEHEERGGRSFGEKGRERGHIEIHLVGAIEGFLLHNCGLILLVRRLFINGGARPTTLEVRTERLSQGIAKRNKR